MKQVTRPPLLLGRGYSQNPEDLGPLFGVQGAVLPGPATGYGCQAGWQQFRPVGQHEVIAQSQHLLLYCQGQSKEHGQASCSCGSPGPKPLLSLASHPKVSLGTHSLGLPCPASCNPCCLLPFAKEKASPCVSSLPYC